MKKSKETKIKQVEEQAPEFDHGQLLAALYWIWDAFDRSLMNMFVVGKTAEAIRTNKALSGDKVMVAVRDAEWDSGARTIMDTFAPPKIDASGPNGRFLAYDYNGVPVTLFVLPDHPTLHAKNAVLYEQESFLLPNPYEEFVKQYPWLNL